jgi:chromosome segregation ATPase
MIEMDTLTLVRWRLAEGRTIADSDVHKLVAQIDQLKDELSEAVERGDDWCDQAKKARAQAANADAQCERDAERSERAEAERDRMKDALHRIQEMTIPGGFINKVASAALKEAGGE